MPVKTNKKCQKNSWKIVHIGSFLTTAILLSACATKAPEKTPVASKSTVVEQKHSFITENESRTYGVTPTAKPLSYMQDIIKRTAGKAKLGTPYRINGQWYFPKEDKDYSKVGYASWYGGNFHGRLTANGEVYDMNHLTAAHPTMPLPSYARVTNLENGSSLIVRVNDRGPYAKDRIIDLSKSAAIMLDYKDNGTANVKVEYVGRAPTDANDDSYLLSSYQPGINAPDMMMSFGRHVNKSLNFDHDAVKPTLTEKVMPKLPEVGPIVEERPEIGQLAAYASEAKPNSKAAIFAAVLNPQQSGTQKYADNQSVELGVFNDKEKIVRIYEQMKSFGDVKIQTFTNANNAGKQYHLSLVSIKNADMALQKAWALGAHDAFIVR